MSRARVVSLGLALVLGGTAACDHKERRNENPAAESWSVADRAMTQRMSELRDRQKILAGRIGALSVPDGTEDAGLTSTIAELGGQVGTIDAACNAAEAALTQARADAEAALAATDRIGAARRIEAGRGSFETAAQAADAAMNQLEPKVIAGEQIMKRLLAEIAAQVERLTRLAKDGGAIDFSDIDFRVGTAEFDFTHVASKATLDRLVGFSQSCPELRFSLTGHTSKEGNPARNRALSLARAEAVKAFLVGRGTPAAAIVATAGKGSAESLSPEPDPGTPAEAAMDPAQLETIRRRNRRVNVTVVTPCGRPPSAEAPTAPAPMPGHEGHQH